MIKSNWGVMAITLLRLFMHNAAHRIKDDAIKWKRNGCILQGTFGMDINRQWVFDNDEPGSKPFDELRVASFEHNQWFIRQRTAMQLHHHDGQITLNAGELQLESELDQEPPKDAAT